MMDLCRRRTGPVGVGGGGGGEGGDLVNVSPGSESTHSRRPSLIVNERNRSIDRFQLNPSTRLWSMTERRH